MPYMETMILGVAGKYIVGEVDLVSPNFKWPPMKMNYIGICFEDPTRAHSMNPLVPYKEHKNSGIHLWGGN